MSYFTRIRNVFRQTKVHREIEEELADHIDYGVKAGRSRAEIERALGGLLHQRETTTDVKLAVWLDSLKSDALFGVRQLRSRPTATAAAVLSLALAIGSITAAFRLIDAVLLRPLPVASPLSLYTLAFSYVDSATGKTEENDGFSYPLFREFRRAAGDDADLMVVSGSGRVDVTYGSDDEMERAYRQQVSGTHFGILGLQPALGRLLTQADDVTPGGHPIAVLSYDYWNRRFGRDPKVIGRTFRFGTVVYEIIGVVQRGYTGTEPGSMTDFFIPAMQNAKAINEAGWSWMRIWMRPKAGANLEQLRQRLQAAMSAHRRERLKEWPADAEQKRKDEFVNTPLVVNPAAAGTSFTQRQYRQSLYILAFVVLLVLLIACANVANLLTAQAAARAKEMALRVSIGAGRGRLVQLMLVESLILAIVATVAGGLFSWWAAPVVVGMINPPDNPLRLVMPADWRVLGFSAAVALGVTVLFGLAPALRASAVKPTNALKGGDDPHSRRRLMNALVAVQVAFCFIVHFGAGLFVGTFERLSTQPTGFSSDRVLLLEADVKGSVKRPQVNWEEITSRIRETPGVEAVGYAGWALMSGNGWSSDVRFQGKLPSDSITPYFLGVSKNWLEAMRIGLIDGRDFLSGERPARLNEQKEPVDGPAIVNEAFAKKYFDGQNPVGKSFETLDRDNKPLRNVIVGYTKDARYRNMREPLRPTVYVPFDNRSDGTFVVRANSDAGMLSLALPLRKLVSSTRPEFRVSNVRTQAELVRNQTIRERLLATVSFFFAVVALVLAAVGLYGVMHYAVLQRRREIGIRMALGARAGHVARQVSADVFLMLIVGSGVGLIAGLASERYIQTLLYGVKGTDLAVLATPLITLVTATLLAALPPVMSATRTDPVTALRSE